MEKYANAHIKYRINCIIDSPTALLQCHTWAMLVDSITFNTTKLTENVYGCHKGDVFVDKYVQKHLFPVSPFARIDEKSVGALIHISIKKSKELTKKCKFGCIGEHVVDAKSVEYFEKIGIDFLYCTKNQSSIALLASAQGSFIQFLFYIFI